MTLTLEEIEEQFRKAVAKGSFGRAEVLLGEFSTSLKQSMTDLPLEAQQQLLRGALEWLKSARLQAIAKRTHCARKLSDTRAAACYVETGRTVQHYWELQG